MTYLADHLGIALVETAINPIPAVGISYLTPFGISLSFHVFHALAWRLALDWFGSPPTSS